MTRLSLVALFVLGATACSTSGSGSTTTVQPTLVGVTPEDFLLDSRCEAPVDGGSVDAAPGDAGDAAAPDASQSDSGPADAALEGGAADAADDGAEAGATLAIRSYTAQLFEISSEDAGSGALTLPGSSALDCRRPVGFGIVALGARYVARVDLYRQPASELTPLAPGSRIMLDVEGRPVTPIAARSCGRDADGGGVDGAYARDRRTVYVRGCVAVAP